MGQVYVLVSRVTDPQNFVLVGGPPKDLLEDVAAALLARNVDVDKYFEDACSVTREWVYDRQGPRLRDRFKVKFNNEQAIPVKLKSVEDIINPQPDAQVVIHRLLGWMDRIDSASQTGASRPPFRTIDGGEILPRDDEPWWLTDVSRRVTADEEPPGDEDGPFSDIQEEQQAEVSDDDPVSSEAEAAPHTPTLAWRV